MSDQALLVSSFQFLVSAGAARLVSFNFCAKNVSYAHFPILSGAQIKHQTIDTATGNDFIYPGVIVCGRTVLDFLRSRQH